MTQDATDHPRKTGLIHVSSIQIFEKDGRTSIPTVVRYLESGQTQYGQAAWGAPGRSDVTENFKLALGNIDPSRSHSSRATVLCNDGQRRTAVAVAAAFFEGLIKDVEEWVTTKRISRSPHVFVAEPLSFFADGDSDWLANYRSAIRRILKRYFEDVDFLPEPFAVFQYYRYGIRHYHVSERRKYAALVIDFGGGTFDVSVVETTLDGDISYSGRNSRPLGASSKPIGGFFVNECLAEFIARTFCAGRRSAAEIDRGIDIYKRLRNGSLEFGTLSAGNKAFIRNYERILQRCEEWKIRIVESICRWALDADEKAGIWIEVPGDLFSEMGAPERVRFTAHQFREVFISKIWDPHLKPAVESSIRRAAESLAGKPINVVLLSGGSANIRWLEELLKRDLRVHLGSARFTSLTENYQEIVAKGLAVECARRFYSHNGDFSGVTYNPLYLLLNPDARGYECKDFRVISPKGLPDPQVPGQLFSSAEVLSGLVDRDITWRVRLSKPPTQRLDYLFLRESNGQVDLDNIVNVLGRFVATPQSVSFDAHLKVTLRVRSDGTCTPVFVYKSGRDGAPQYFVEGTPFCLDMTEAGKVTHAKAYFGIDFGSSTTAVSYVDSKSVALCEERSRNVAWLELDELYPQLPFPIAQSVRAMQGAYEREELALRTIDALEATLFCLVAVLWAEYRAAGFRRQFKGMAQFRQRSMGPLKQLLDQLLDAGGGKLSIGERVQRIVSVQSKELDGLIKALNNFKHGKESSVTVDGATMVQALANAYVQGTVGMRFGRFEEVVRTGLGQTFRGCFRVAHGTPPFGELYDYEGPHSFSSVQACLIDPEAGVALDLSPLMYWAEDSGHSWAERDLFVLDKRDGRVVEFKVVGRREAKALGDSGFDKELRSLVDGLDSASDRVWRYEGLVFKDRKGERAY